MSLHSIKVLVTTCHLHFSLHSDIWFQQFTNLLVSFLIFRATIYLWSSSSKKFYIVSFWLWLPSDENEYHHPKPLKSPMILLLNGRSLESYQIMPVIQILSQNHWLRTERNSKPETWTCLLRDILSECWMYCLLVNINCFRVQIFKTTEFAVRRQ